MLRTRLQIGIYGLQLKTEQKTQSNQKQESSSSFEGCAAAEGVLIGPVLMTT